MKKLEPNAPMIICHAEEKKRTLKQKLKVMRVVFQKHYMSLLKYGMNASTN